MYYTASGIVIPVGGRPVRSLRSPLSTCARDRCCIIQFLPPDDEHIVLKICRGTYYKTRICEVSWLITKIILRCTVSKTSKINK